MKLVVTVWWFRFCCFVSVNAPVCKGLMGCMFLTCTALNVPVFAHLKKLLKCKIPDSIYDGEVTMLIHI